MFRYLKAGAATFSFWEAPPITEDFVASRAGKCRCTGRRQIADGEEIVIDGRYQSFTIEHATSDMLYFQAMARTGAAPLAAEYDAETLAFIGASSTDEASSRVQMMVSLLRTMEREDALPLIEESLNSPHFYTRGHHARDARDGRRGGAAGARRGSPPTIRIPRSHRAQQTLEFFRGTKPSRRQETSSAALIDAQTTRSWSWPDVEMLGPAISTARKRTISPTWGIQLKRLANDRSVLATDDRRMKAALRDQVRDNQYSAQVVMLHGRRKNS